MAASQAEVDLVVNATRTLPQLERDLDRVLNAAQADMSDLDVNAVLRSTQSLNDIERDLSRIIRQAGDDADPVVIQAAMRQRDEIRRLQGDLTNVVNAVNRDGSVDPLLAQVAINVPDAIADLDDQLRHVVRAVNAIAPDIEIDVDVDRNSITRLTAALLPLAANLGKVTGGVVALSAAAGAVAPLLASVAVAVENVIPAAAVATTGILAFGLAMGAVKLGVLGFSDALTEAFSADSDAKKLNEALKGLAPSARATAKEIISMKDGLKDLQLDVQDRLFRNFDQAVKALGATALPVVSAALQRTATTFNQMGIAAAQAAVRISADGTLGRALKSATNGLNDLKEIPGQIVTGFTQIAAAAGPSFERVTTAVAGLADRISESLASAFESGALEDAISGALDSLAQLGRSFGNVFSGIGNIIKAVSSGGEGLFATFERVSQAFEDLTASTEFREGLQALASVSSTVSKTVLPLLAQALKIVGEVLVVLAPPVKAFVTAIGQVLSSLLTALRPVLIAVAGAFGSLLEAVAPIISLAGDLIVALLPALIPLFETLGGILAAVAPTVKALADDLSLALVPVLASLGPILQLILPPFVELAEELMPLLTDALVQLAPSFEEVGVAVGNLLISLAPLIVTMIEFLTKAIVPIVEAGLPLLIDILITVAKVFTFLVDVIRTVVVPNLQAMADTLNGDFTSAWQNAQEMISGFKDAVARILTALTGKTRAQLSELAVTVLTKINDAGNNLVNGVQSAVNSALTYIGDLPGRAQNALGNLGNTLYGAGRDLIQGLINGIQSRIGDAINAARNAANSVANSVKGALGINSPSKVMAELGGFTMDGFILGIRKALPELENAVSGIGLSVQAAATPSRLAAPAAGTMLAPTVLVSIGNEAIDQYVTTRVVQVSNNRDRTAAQGVRQ